MVLRRLTRVLLDVDDVLLVPFDCCLSAVPNVESQERQQPVVERNAVLMSLTVISIWSMSGSIACAPPSIGFVDSTLVGPTTRFDFHGE